VVRGALLTVFGDCAILANLDLLCLTFSFPALTSTVVVVVVVLDE